MRKLLPLLFLASLSCGQMQPGDEPAAGRLRKKLYVTMDGDRVALFPTYFYDTKLHQDCVFLACIKGGRIYCTPPSAAECPADLGAYAYADPTP